MLISIIGNAQYPKLILPIGYTTRTSSVSFSPDGTKVLTSGDNRVKLCDAQSGLTLIEKVAGENYLETACFSPDGKKILTSSLDHSAKIWNAQSGALLVDLKGRAGMLNASFSADGRKVITSTDSNSKIWDAETGVLLADLKGQSKEPANTYFSPDGRKVVTVLDDSTARIWYSDNGKTLFTLRGHRNKIRTACFSPDGQKIVTASDDGTAKLWNAGNGVLIKNLIGRSYYYAFNARFSPDGKNIVTTFSSGISPDGSYTMLTEIWNANTGSMLKVVKGNVSMALFSSDSKMMVTINGEYKQAKIWNTENWHLIRTLNCNCGWFRNFCFSSDNKRFLLTGEGDLAQIWDIKSGSLLTNLKGHTIEPWSLTFFPDGNNAMIIDRGLSARSWNRDNGTLGVCLNGEAIHCVSPDVKKIFTMRGSNTCRIWQVVNGAAVSPLTIRTGTRKVSFSPDSKTFLTQPADSTINIWDLASGVVKSEFKDSTGWIGEVCFSPDGQKLLTATDYNMRIWDVNKGLSLLFIKDYGNQDPKFSPDGRKIIARLGDTAKIWDAETGKLLFKLGEPRSTWFSRSLFSTDNKRILTVNSNNIGEIWDAQTGVLLATMKGHKDQITTIKISPDGKKIATTSWDNTAKIWDSQSGVLLADLRGHQDKVTDAEFSPDDKTIMTISDDNTAKVWDAGNGKLLYTFFALDSSDYFVQLPSDYYKCTPNAAKLLHYVDKDLKVISFEQLDVKYNRPDLVLEGIGCPDTSLIQSYKKAWQKRIAKLGFDTSLFTGGLHVPEAVILNRDGIEYEQTSNKISLKINGKDDSVVLDRFNLWINEVPLFGVNGISLKSRDTRDFDTTIMITLSNGNNRIETSVTNIGGLESYREPLDLKYTAPKPLGEKLYFIGIGMDHFKDSKYNLSWSIKDIRDLARNFKKKYGSYCIIDTLFDTEVGTGNIRALKQILLKTNENDKVIVAYSGHGLLSKDYDYFLSTYNVNFQEPERGGLPYGTLEDLLDSIPARKKLLLIDACHSGEVDKEEVNKMVKAQVELDSTKKGVIVLMDTTNKRLGTKNSFELMQEVFVNVGRSTGATVISAAAGTQFALERGDLRNGVFTYSILELMKNKQTVTVSELKKYVNQRVTDLTHGMQVPTSRSENKVIDWQVW